MTAVSASHCSYAAGAIDSDGCIFISRVTGGGDESYSLCVTLQQTSPLVPQWLQEHFGGHLYRNKHPRDSGRFLTQWTIHRKLAKPFLEAIYPFVVLKKAQVWLALEFLAQCPAWHRGGSPRSAEHCALQKGYYLAMKEAKRV